MLKANEKNEGSEAEEENNSTEKKKIDSKLSIRAHLDQVRDVEFLPDL